MQLRLIPSDIALACERELQQGGGAVRGSLAKRNGRRSRRSTRTRKSPPRWGKLRRLAQRAARPAIAAALRCGIKVSKMRIECALVAGEGCPLLPAPQKVPKLFRSSGQHGGRCREFQSGASYPCSRKRPRRGVLQQAAAADVQDWRAATNRAAASGGTCPRFFPPAGMCPAFAGPWLQLFLQWLQPGDT